MSDGSRDPLPSFKIIVVFVLDQKVTNIQASDYGKFPYAHEVQSRLTFSAKKGAFCVANKQNYEIFVN